MRPGSVHLPILGYVLRGDRRALVLWAVAVSAVAAIYTSSFATVAGLKQSAISNLPAALVKAMDLGAFSSPGGYLGSTVYGILGPALTLVFAISLGARLIAGQEQDGTLELELTHPVSRRRIYLERLGALWLGALALVAALTVTVLVLSRVVGMDIGVGRVLAGSSGLLLLVLALGSLAFAVGAATGRRPVALGVAAAVAVLAYASNALGTVMDSGWLVAVSPWSWYLGGHPLTDGFDGAGLLKLFILLVVATTVGAVTFDRRDLGV